MSDVDFKNVTEKEAKELNLIADALIAKHSNKIGVEKLEVIKSKPLLVELNEQISFWSKPVSITDYSNAKAFGVAWARNKMLECYELVLKEINNLWKLSPDFEDIIEPELMKILEKHFGVLPEEKEVDER